MKLFTKPILLGAGLFGAFLLSSALTAPVLQDTPPPVEEVVELPGPREVVDRYLEVSGIAKFAPKFKSQRSVGTLEIVGMGMTGTAESLAMKPNLNLTTVELAMMGLIRTGHDGKVAWRIHPMLGEQILDGAELAQLERRTVPFVSEFKKEEMFEVMETVEKLEWEGMTCYKLRFVDKPYENVDLPAEETEDIREFFEYYDVETGFLVGQTSLSASPQGDVPTRAVMSDYKKFGEVMSATVTMIKVSGIEIKAVTTELEFNKLEDQSIFELPAEIQVLLEDEPEDAGGASEGDGK